MSLRACLIISMCLGCAEGPPMPDGGCAVTPIELDFGEVDFGSSKTAVFMVSNYGNRRVVLVEPIAPPFFNLQSGEVFLNGASSLPFAVSFLPRDALLHLGKVRLTDRDLETGTACDVTVPMRGLGAGTVLASPTSLDFGFLEVGQSRTLEVRVDNPRREEMTLNISVENQLNAPFTVSAPDGNVLPARGSTVLSVTATPGLANLGSGRLLIALSHGPRIIVPLRFTVGVPVAELSPVEALPRVGFSPGAEPPSFADRVIQLRNVGTTGTFNDARLRLRGMPALDGAAPFTVEALDGGSADELTVSMDQLLLQGLSVGQFGAVNVHLEPRSPGPRLYRITVHTNEPADHVLMLQTVAEVLPPCSMQVEPLGVLHLARTPDGASSGTVTFTNTGLETCFIDDLRLISYPLYSIVSGGPAQVAVLPGARHAVTIAGPREAVARTIGALNFHVISPNSIRVQREIFSTP